MNDLNKLKEPFPVDDIEWRIQKSGIGQKTKKPYALVLAYLTNRAIQERLDAVVGPENWQNDYRPAPNGGGVLCGIGIHIDSGWVWKWDGSENTQFEAVKGGLSASMKRAAVQWGIGRYLYNLEAGFAIFDEHGKYKDKIENEWYRWNPPALPSWAIPGPSLKMQEAILKANTKEEKASLDAAAEEGWEKPVKQEELY